MSSCSHNQTLSPHILFSNFDIYAAYSGTLYVHYCRHQPFFVLYYLQPTVPHCILTFLRRCSAIFSISFSFQTWWLSASYYNSLFPQYISIIIIGSVIFWLSVFSVHCVITMLAAVIFSIVCGLASLLTSPVFTVLIIWSCWVSDIVFCCPINRHANWTTECTRWCVTFFSHCWGLAVYWYMIGDVIFIDYACI